LTIHRVDFPAHTAGAQSFRCKVPEGAVLVAFTGSLVPASTSILVPQSNGGCPPVRPVWVIYFECPDTPDPENESVQFVVAIHPHNKSTVSVSHPENQDITLTHEGIAQMPATMPPLTAHLFRVIA